MHPYPLAQAPLRRNHYVLRILPFPSNIEKRKIRDFSTAILELAVNGSAQEFQGRPCVLVLDNASHHSATVVQMYVQEMSSSF